MTLADPPAPVLRSPAVAEILGRIDALPDDERELLDLHLLARREADRLRAREELEALLWEGMQGEAIEFTPDYFENKKRELLERHGGATS